jgi:hypothetical protein
MIPPKHTDKPAQLEAYYAGATAAQHGKPRVVPSKVSPRQHEAWLEGWSDWWTAEKETA